MTIPYIIPIIIILFLNKILILNGYKYLLIYGSIYTLLYFVIAYLFSMNQYEKNLIKKITNRLKHTK